MLEEFLETIHKNKMIEKGEGIVIGVSGGPDSISLLHLLWKIKDEYSLKLYAVHLNHQFRGTEADEDAEYVKLICEKLGIKAFIFSENVGEYSKQKSITFEEAGREIRYALFDQVMKETKSKKIAIAQNMDDQAETVLMRLMRGTGLEGLCAIDYVRDGKIIRPLLNISRNEIEEYCSKNHLSPRIDRTNLEAVYTRNRIRLELIPYIEKYFNRNIKETLSRTSNLMKEDRDFISIVVKNAYESATKIKQSEVLVHKEEFLKNHRTIQKRILREAIFELSGDLKNVQNKHIEKLMEFIYSGRNGTALDLPKGLCAILKYKYFSISKEKKEIERKKFEYNVNIGEILHIEESDADIIASIVDRKDIKKPVKEKYKKYFDWDKVQNSLVLRNRRNGDRFTPFGMKGSKKLKDFFIDEKISKSIRDEICLICEGNKIMWVIGHRMSENYKIDDTTQKILVLTYIKKNERSF